MRRTCRARRADIQTSFRQWGGKPDLELVIAECIPLNDMRTLAHIDKRTPAPLDTADTHTLRFRCSCTVARQGQRAAQTLVAVCLHHLSGVGVNALAGHQARRRVGAVRPAEEQDVRLRPGGGRCGGRLRGCDQVAHATRERWIARDEPVAGTCGWNSAPTRGSAARPRRATPSQSAAAPWVHSWQCAWAR